MDVVEPGIKRVEKSTPQWVWKDMVLFSLEQARMAYKKVKTDLNYMPYRTSSYEKELSEGINDLWGLVGTKVIKRINKAKQANKTTGYEELPHLDDLYYKPNAHQLLRYYRLFSDFVDDLGITRIEESSYEIDSKSKALDGFVKNK